MSKGAKVMKNLSKNFSKNVNTPGIEVKKKQNLEDEATNDIIFLAVERNVFLSSLG